MVTSKCLHYNNLDGALRSSPPSANQLRNLNQPSYLHGVSNLKTRHPAICRYRADTAIHYPVVKKLANADHLLTATDTKFGGDVRDVLNVDAIDAR